jgi:prolyl-tRNA editing enzyme YbaK/EbsC (Cys-tRNA(Pro) deacylase)
VLEGRDGWGVFDDGAFLDLGPLEGNQGDANYEIPAGADLGTLQSVSIWCARFRVSVRRGRARVRSAPAPYAPVVREQPPGPPAPDDLAEHPGVARVRAALAAADLADRVVVLDGHARTAAEAAASLGVEVAQIANSLVFLATPHDSPGADSPAAEPFPVLVLASGGHRVDTARVARALGVASLARATPELVRSATGFVIGGVAPVGHLHPLPTLVDADLARHDAVWAAAGHPRTVFPTSHDELVRLTGGASAGVAAEPAG